MARAGPPLSAAEQINKSVTGGEGARLVDVARDAVLEGLALDRDARAREVPLVTTTGDNTEWCRGAAVIAIQTHVLGAARQA